MEDLLWLFPLDDVISLFTIFLGYSAGIVYVKRRLLPFAFTSSLTAPIKIVQDNVNPNLIETYPPEKTANFQIICKTYVKVFPSETKETLLSL